MTHTTKTAEFFAFIGQNASTGTPHPQTGNYSQYGDIIAFSTIEKRDEFVDEYYNQNNPSEYAEKCNRSSARGYCLGMSVADFNDYVIDQAISCIDEHYDSYFA